MWDGSNHINNYSDDLMEREVINQFLSREREREAGGRVLKERSGLNSLRRPSAANRRFPLVPAVASGS